MTIYKQNIPQPADVIANSQVDLLNNFTYLDTFLDVEHIQNVAGVRSNASVGSGRHRTMSMPNAPGAVDPAVPAGTTGILYNLNSNLLFRNGGAITQITGYSVNTTPALGHIPLLGAMLLNWGLITVPAGVTTYTVDQTFSSAANFFGVVLTPVGGSVSNTASQYKALPINANQFTVSSIGYGTSNFFYIAIGK